MMGLCGTNTEQSVAHDISYASRFNSGLLSWNLKQKTKLVSSVRNGYCSKIRAVHVALSVPM